MNSKSMMSKILVIATELVNKLQDVPKFITINAFQQQTMMESSMARFHNVAMISEISSVLTILAHVDLRKTSVEKPQLAMNHPSRQLLISSRNALTLVRISAKRLFQTNH